MTRRFQFSLRTLLIALVTVCIALGGWHLYFVFFGPYVEAAPTVAGQPIFVRGRFFDFFGMPSTVYVVQVVKLGPNGKPITCQSGSGYVQRSGLWSYNIEVELSPINKPGEYDLELMGLTKAVRAKKRTMQKDPVRAKLSILAREGD